MIDIKNNKIENLIKDLPQLIVALDSLDDSANYIHIADAKEDTTYYCPCCKGIIKPRAYKDDKEYQVQPHYYHEKDGCNEETFIHYICKTWLFETGCKFKVEDVLYEVTSIETERTYHTEFGDYRPDITVTTSSGKVFFFEIKHSSRKTEHYIPKWDELGNDVVEVDTRYFINQKVDNSTPEFKLIYSNGECFIKSYTKKDYDETIALRKLEWKRQDKLNYKIMWERLDWFWNEVQNYKNENSSTQNVIDKFSQLTYEDMEFCIEIIKKIKCKDLFYSLIPVINSNFMNIINDFSIKPYDKIEFIQESPRILYVSFLMDSINGMVNYYYGFAVYGNFNYYNQKLLLEVIQIVNSDGFKNKKIKNMPHKKAFEKIHELHPKFRINMYEGNREYISATNIENYYTFYKFVYENTYYHLSSSSSIDYLERYIKQYERQIYIDKQNELYKTKLDKIINSKWYKKFIFGANQIMCHDSDLKIIEDKSISYQSFKISVKDYYINKTIFSVDLMDEKLVFNDYKNIINELKLNIDNNSMLKNNIIQFRDNIDELVAKINMSNNKLWICSIISDYNNTQFCIEIKLLDKRNRLYINYNQEKFNNIDSIKKEITKTMNNLLKTSGLNSDIRVIR